MSNQEVTPVLREDPAFRQSITDRLAAGGNIAEEMAVVGEMLAQDPEYLWTWHCNLTMAFVDSGGDRRTAMEGSRRFLSLLADVDVGKHPQYISDMKQLSQ